MSNELGRVPRMDVLSQWPALLMGSACSPATCSLVPVLPSTSSSVPLSGDVDPLQQDAPGDADYARVTLWRRSAVGVHGRGRGEVRLPPRAQGTHRPRA